MGVSEDKSICLHVHKLPIDNQKEEQINTRKWKTTYKNPIHTSTLGPKPSCLEWFSVPKINTYFHDPHVSIAIK